MIDIGWMIDNPLVVKSVTTRFHTMCTTPDDFWQKSMISISKSIFCMIVIYRSIYVYAPYCRRLMILIDLVGSFSTAINFARTRNDPMEDLAVLV